MSIQSVPIKHLKEVDTKHIERMKPAVNEAREISSENDKRIIR